MSAYLLVRFLRLLAFACAAGLFATARLALAGDTAAMPVLASHVKASDIRGHALVIHAGANRYDSHATHEHSKGEAKVYCGVIR